MPGDFELLPCEEVEQAIPWLLDDELDPDHTRDIERHLGGCVSCRATLEAEGRLRLALRRAADSMAAPARLRRRLHEAMEQERVRSSAMSRRWPAVAAAAILLAFLIQGAWGDSPEDLQEAAARHARNLPMDVVASSVSEVQDYLSSKLPFAVHLPRPAAPLSQYEQPAVMGGRITQIANRDAAYVRYETPRGRVSMFVYEGQDTPMLEPGPSYRMGNERVFVKRVRGYTTLRWHRDGLVYSLVADLPEREVLELGGFRLADAAGR